MELVNDQERTGEGKTEDVRRVLTDGGIGRLAARYGISLEVLDSSDFPAPYVTRPTLEQFVRGARVEYEVRPGETESGWVDEAGILPTRYRGLTEPEASVPKAPGVMVSVNQPGSAAVAFLASEFVPLEKVLRVTCAPDTAPEQNGQSEQEMLAP